jgi:hypothetical protein
MKANHVILLISITFTTLITSAQSSIETFARLKEYYYKYSNTGKKVDIDYNRAEKMINLGNVNFPLKKVRILYEEINGFHVVTFNCEGCILSLDKLNRPSYLDGIGIEFNSKAECYKFIDLLSEFREKI